MPDPVVEGFFATQSKPAPAGLDPVVEDFFSSAPTAVAEAAPSGPRAPVFDRPLGTAADRPGLMEAWNEGVGGRSAEALRSGVETLGQGVRDFAPSVAEGRFGDTLRSAGRMIVGGAQALASPIIGNIEAIARGPENEDPADVVTPRRKQGVVEMLAQTPRQAVAALAAAPGQAGDVVSKVTPLSKDDSDLAVGVGMTAAGALAGRSALKGAKVIGREAGVFADLARRRAAMELAPPKQVVIDPAAIEIVKGRPVAPGTPRALPAPPEPSAPPVATEAPVARSAMPPRPPEPWRPLVASGENRPISGRVLPAPAPDPVVEDFFAAPEVPPVRPAVPPESPAAARPVEAVPAEAAPREAPASPPRPVAEPEAPPARMPVAEAPVAEGVAPGGAGQAPRKVTPVAKNRFILQEQGADGMWRKSGEAKTAAEAQAWESGTKTGDQVGTKLTTAPAEVVKQTQPASGKGRSASNDARNAYVDQLTGEIEALAKERDAISSRLTDKTPDDSPLHKRIDAIEDELGVLEAKRFAVDSDVPVRQHILDKVREDVRQMAEPAQAPAVSEKVPTISDKVEPPVQAEPPLVAKMRAEPDAEARAAIWRDAARTDRAAAEEAISWARRKQAERGEKDGSFIGRDAVERELNPPKPKKIKGGGGKRRQSGAIGGGPTPPIGDMIRGAEKVWEKGVTGVGSGVSGLASKATSKLPAVRAAAETIKRIYDLNFKHRPKLIDQTRKGYDAATTKHQGLVAYAHELGRFYEREIPKALSNLSDAELDQVTSYVGSEATELPAAITPKGRAMIDQFVQMTNANRAIRHELGRGSEESMSEYPRYAVRKFVNEIRKKRSGGGLKIAKTGETPRLPEIENKQDAYSVSLEMPKKEALGILDEVGINPLDFRILKYIGEQDGRTLMKFGPTEGRPTDSHRYAREAFINKLEEKFGKAAKDLDKAATKEMKAEDVDVGQAKMLHKASLDTPRRRDFKIRTEDPLSDEYRTEAGEIRNPASVLAQTAMEVQREVAHQTLLDEVATKWAKEPANPREAPPEGYVRVENSKLGPLNGKFVPEDIMEDLTGYVDIVDKANAKLLHVQFMDMLKGIHREAKVGTTLLNPRNYGQNYYSFITEGLEAGVNPITDNAIFKEAWARAKAADPMDPATAERIKNGIILPHGGQFSAAELHGVGDESVGYGIGRDIASLGFRRTRAYRWINEKGARLYNRTTNVIRDMRYTKLRNRGVSEADAVAEVNEVTSNPERSPALVKQIRQAPVFGAGFTWASERMRILKNLAIKYPVRILASIGAVLALREALEESLGADVSDEEKKGAHAAGSSMFTAVIGRKEDGTVRTLDLGPASTADQVFRGPRQVVKGQWKENLKWVVNALGGGLGAVPELAYIWGADETSGGRELRSAGERLQASAETVVPAVTPFLGRQSIKVQNAIMGKSSSKSRPAQDPWEATLDALAYARFQPYDPAMYRAAIYKQAERADNGDTTPDERREIWKRAAELRAPHVEAQEAQRKAAK